MKVRRFAVSALALFATFAVWANTETVGEITWTYQIIGNTAQVGDGGSPAISDTTTGAITIPSKLGGKPVTSIGAYAFNRCSKLTSVTIPSGVTSIGNFAFFYCSGLTSVTIPSGVTSIGASAFTGCSLLSKLCIDSVESWCKISFADSASNPFCSSSEAKTLVVGGQPTTVLVILAGVTAIPANAFHGWSMITSVTIPESVTSIGSDAFMSCKGLTSVTIEEGVKSIGSDAFYGCSGLTSVTIPASVGSIGGWAFFNCSSLKQATVLAEYPPTGGTKMFNGTANDFVILVPEESVTDYKGAEGWKTYENQIQAAPRAGVNFTAGAGVEKIEFKCYGEFIEFPAGGTNLTVGTVIDLMVTPKWPFYYAGETQFIVPKEGTNVTINATGRMPDVKLTAGEGVEKIEFKCNGEGEFVEFPAGGTNLMAGTVIDLMVKPEWPFYYAGETRFTVSKDGIDEEISVTRIPDVKFMAGEGVEKIEFKCNGESEFVEFPAGGTNLMVGTVIDLQVATTENYRYTGETQFTVPDAGLDETITATEIAWGDKERPWAVGETVTAYTNGVGGLVIQGSGAMYDFADAEDVPWADVAKEVTAVTIEEGVTQVGKNALAGFTDEVTVNGTPLSTYRKVATVETKINDMTLDDFNAAVRFLNVGEEWKEASPASSEPIIPDNMVLVAKESIQAAKAEAVSIADGVVSLGVTVNTNGNFTAETKSWAPVELKPENVEVENGKIVISIPVSDKSGFMILQSGDAKVGATSGGGPAANHAVQVAGGLYLDGEAEDQVVRLGDTAKKANDNSSDK